MSQWDEMERRVRKRGVRVDERLELLRLLRGDAPAADLREGSPETIALRHQYLMRAVQVAMEKVKEAIG